MHIAELPALGAPLENGVFRGLITLPAGTHHAIAELPDTPPERMTHAGARTWAASLGGQLPTRPMGAIALANGSTRLAEDTHWLDDEYDGAYAWYQTSYGGQSFGHRSALRAAVAVRLIPLTL